MERRMLGNSGLAVSAQGLGCGGMSEVYGKPNVAEAVATIHRALELGVNFLDTGALYGDGDNEELVGRAIGGRRDEVVLATKFAGHREDENGTPTGSLTGRLVINGRPEFIHESCDASLRRLGTDYVDLFYQHRVDPSVPIEESVGAMTELVDAGKVRYLGLCEASAATIRRAVTVSPIAALQSQWSMWARDLEADVVQAARNSGVGIVAFSPLGRGFLTGKLTNPNELEEGDLRRRLPRFQEEHFAANQQIIKQMSELAEEKGCTVGQLALAWVLSRGKDVVPIPGTKRRTYLEENVAASDVELTALDLDRLELAEVSGDHYSVQHTYGDSPPLIAT